MGVIILCIYSYKPGDVQHTAVRPSTLYDHTTAPTIASGGAPPARRAHWLLPYLVLRCTIVAGGEQHISRRARVNHLRYRRCSLKSSTAQDRRCRALFRRAVDERAADGESILGIQQEITGIFETGSQEPPTFVLQAFGNVRAFREARQRWVVSGERS